VTWRAGAVAAFLLWERVLRASLLSLFLTSCVGVVGDEPTAASDAGSVGPDASTPMPDAGMHDAGTSTPDAGPADPCASVHCGSGAHCAAGACSCDVGFIFDAGSCFAGDPGIPALRSQQQVCDAYAAGRRVVDNNPFSKSSMSCDPGTLSMQGLSDTLTRLDMFRYLAGLGPVAVDMSSNAAAQACALLSESNPAGQQAHSPPPTSTCYSSAGAGMAGESNIAWGCNGPADCIDEWMVDNGNESTFGHRRWLLNPPLGPIAFGYYEGAGQYGSASCIEVFNASGQGPNPSFIAFPPPGFVPLELTQWDWTVQGDLPYQDAGVTIHDSSGASLNATLVPLSGNYGFSDAVMIDHSGWSPAVGETYHVAITGEGHAAIEYDVKPVSCP
jgi:hypothetical protein